MARQRKISGGLLAAAAGLGVLTPLMVASAASAHTPVVSSTCDSLTVKLTAYDAKFKNTVTVTIDGKAVLTDQQFPATFDQTFKVDPKHAAPLSYVVKVATSQDPENPSWNRTLTGSIVVCPVTVPSPSPSVSHSASPSASPAVKPSGSTAPSPSVSPTGAVLASTGGGSNAGVIAGAGAAVIAIGGGLLFMNRRRQAGRH